MPSEAVEAEGGRALTRHYEELGHWDAPQAVAAAMSLDGVRDRLAYVTSKVPQEIFSERSAVLIFGMGVGGEMLVARGRGGGELPSRIRGRRARGRVCGPPPGALFGWGGGGGAGGVGGGGGAAGGA